MDNSQQSRPLYIREDEVQDLLDWPMTCHAIEQAFISVSNAAKANAELPFSTQPARTFVQAKDGVLLCMPGFVGNHSVNPSTNSRTSSLACKLITSFPKNAGRDPALPPINGEIFLFNENTGKLQATIEANYLTGLRTAAASIVATQQLYLARQPKPTETFTLGIIGTGFQGEMHARGFMLLHQVAKVRLWNRTAAKSIALKAKLEKLGLQTNISVHDTVEECCKDCDVIVTATRASQPLVKRSFLKQNVHINAVGAGDHHHSELAQDVYDDCSVYIDYWNGARNELASLKANIVGEVGELLTGKLTAPSGGITVFQSLGMAVEDVTVAKLLYSNYVQMKNL